MVDDGGDLKKTAFTNISDWVPTRAIASSEAGTSIAMNRHKSNERR